MERDFADPNPVGLPTGREFTNTMLNSRRLIRTAKNPLDKCTIVSIFPKAIDEIKPTIEPGHFHIDAGTYEKPALLIVGGSSWWKDIDADQPMVEIPNGSIQIANSVINDYCNGYYGCNMADCMPGLFFALGEQTVLKIKVDYKKQLEIAKERQDNWYRVLVREADGLWARSNNNPLVIMEEMKLAARSLNYNDKPWLKDFIMSRQVQCKACGSLKNPDFPVCLVCKAVDQSHPLAASVKFAQ